MQRSRRESSAVQGWPGRGPQLKWMKMNGPATARAAMSTTAPPIHQMSLRRLRVTIDYTFRAADQSRGMAAEMMLCAMPIARGLW